MKCSEISDLFSPYIDDEISAAEKRLVEEHLSCCPDCAEELSQLQKMTGLLRNMGNIDIAVPAGLRKNVMARINEVEQPLAAKSDGKIASWLGLPRYKGLVAVAASVLILGFGYWGFSGERAGIMGKPTEIAHHDQEEKDAAVTGPRVESPRSSDHSGNDTAKPEALPEQSSESASGTGTKSTAPDTERVDRPEQPAGTAPAVKPSPGPAAPSGSSKVTMLNVEKKSLTASIQLSAEEEEAAVAVVKGLAEQYQVEFSRHPLDQAVLIQLKVPNKDFAPIVADVEKLGQLKDKKIQEKDLTPQYKQIQSRILQLEGQRKGLDNDSDQAKMLDAQINSLNLQLAHLDQQADNAFIAIWIE